MSLAVAVAAAASACGVVKELTAAEKVQDAFDKLGTAHAVTVDFRLAATADQLLALDAQDPAGGGKLTRDQAAQLAGVGVTLSVSSDKPLKDALKGGAAASSEKLDPALNMDLAVHSGTGATLAEVRAVAGKEYVKVDLAAIAKTDHPSGQGSAGDLADLKAMSDSMPPSMGALKNLFQGKWVSIDPAKFAAFSKSLQGAGAAAGGSSPSPVPSLDAAQQKKLTDALTGVLEQDVHLTDKGTKDGLDTIELKADNTRTLLADVQKQVFPVLKEIPGFPGGLPESAPTGAPTTPAVATLAIAKDGGALRSITVDAGQFDTAHPGTHLPLVLGFKDTATTVTAPAGAVEFDPDSLKDMMSGLVGGSLD